MRYDPITEGTELSISATKYGLSMPLFCSVLSSKSKLFNVKNCIPIHFTT
jgi:hypothetical protein